MFRPKLDRVEYGGALIGMEEVKAVMDVMLSQGGRRWTIGPESEAFEKELAENTGCKRAVVTNSGSSALLVAMTALHLPKGANVAIPAVNFPTAFNAIIQNNLTPVVVDTDPKTLNIDLNQLRGMIGKGWQIDAVIAVDIAGNPVDLEELRRVVGDRVKIILDNCDGYGTLLRGKYIDTYADISCVSFHAAHIITTGEGGACLTDSEELADRCRKIREWGRASGSDTLYRYPGFPKDYRERYVYEEIGYNVKPLELQCAMGRVQLKKVEQFREARKKNFDLLMKEFETIDGLEPVEYLKDSDPCWFSFPFMCRKYHRGVVMDWLEENNIECRTIFSGNVLKHPAYKDVNYVSGDLSNADDVMFNGVFISVHPSVTPEMIAFIGEVLRNIPTDVPLTPEDLLKAE